MRLYCIVFVAISATLASTVFAGEVTLCRAVRDLTPVEPTTRFPSGVKEVHAVFKLDENEKIGKLTSTWIAVDVGDAAPPNYSITSADLDLNGQKIGRLSYTQPGPMPDGKYRVEIRADGKPWQTLTFTVGADPATQPAK